MFFFEAGLRIRLLTGIALALACGSSEPGGSPLPEDVPAGESGGNGSGTGGTSSPGGSGPILVTEEPLGGEGGAGSEDVCVGEEASAAPTPTVLELLVDTSTSMNADVDGTDRTRWEITRDVMLEAIDLMEDATSVGVVFYPDVAVNADPCFDADEDVSIAALSSASSSQRSAVRSAFQGQEPDGSTPTHDGYVYALERLEANASGGSPFLVLITDGEPTFGLGCEGSGQPGNGTDTEPLITEAGEAFGRGVKTFVIGSPGSEPARESLSRMAEAGGTARDNCSHQGPNYCHFDMTEEADFAEALRDAFASISGATLSCSYEIPPPPNGLRLNPSKVNVHFTSQGAERETIERSRDSECEEGWTYSDDMRQIVLCEGTCSRLQSATGSLSLEFGCDTRDLF